MGIDAFLISSAVEAFIAQRLVRVICQRCKEEDRRDFGEEFRRIGKDGEEIKIYRGRGCKACNNTGYAGRTGIYEILIVDEEIRRLIMRKASSEEIRERAVEKGMRLLKEDGWEKVKAGITTLEEVLRVTQVEV